VQVQKTQGASVQEASKVTASKMTASKANLPPENLLPVHTKHAPGMPEITSRTMANIVNAARLPADKLSASIIMFARFFSLPLKPEILASIRQQALIPNPENPEIAAKMKLTLALAAAAAADKSVEIFPRGLEAYAEAIDPEWQERQGYNGNNPNGQERKKKEKEQNGPDKTGPISAAELKKTVLENAENNPLLAIMNKLPGKNGKYWIALPFSYQENGRNFKVTLRVMLSGENPAESRKVELAAMDIAENGENKKHWLFAFKPKNETINNLNVYHQHKLSDLNKKKLTRKLSLSLEIPEKNILFKNYNEAFPVETTCGNDLLQPVNESV